MAFGLVNYSLPKLTCIRYRITLKSLYSSLTSLGDMPLLTCSDAEVQLIDLNSVADLSTLPTALFQSQSFWFEVIESRCIIRQFRLICLWAILGAIVFAIIQSGSLANTQQAEVFATASS